MANEVAKLKEEAELLKQTNLGYLFVLALFYEIV